MSDDLVARARAALEDVVRSRNRWTDNGILVREGMPQNMLAYEHVMTLLDVAGIIVPELIAELERLHSWDGLMSLLDEHWPEDIFPTMDDRPDRDPGPRIVSLARRLAVLEQAVARVRELHAPVHHSYAGGFDWCRACDQQHPCSTIRALDGTEQ
jgi:hypothetical protein